MKNALMTAAFIMIAATANAQRYSKVHFDSAATAISISNREEYRQRDSIRRAGLMAGDQSATWTRYGEPGWTEHRDPQTDGTIFLYWTNEDPVYQHGKLIGEFWGLAIPDSANYRNARWIWDGGEHAEKASAWYGSVNPDKP